MTLPDDRPAVTRVTDKEILAALCSRASDDEGEFEPLMDLLGFSGENKARTVVRAALEAAAQAKSGQEGEVERQTREREQIALAICGGEDAPGYALSLSVDDLKTVIAARLASKEWNDTQIATLAKAEERVKALEGAAFSAMAAIGEARGFVTYCSKGDGLDHWLVEAQSALAALLADPTTAGDGVGSKGWNEAIEAAAKVVKTMDRDNRTWVPGQLWVNICDRMAVAIRALAAETGGRDGR